ncbi:hypothetical protein FRC07_008580 [Ceratobasidium sp. 392]|nr:hypothetical protein FRC07_008580 [Ceratobasidium sp. 392]
MQGVGQIDAEGCERAWADLNQASRSSSEKGPGFRIDSLNHCMHDWNWRKIVGMVSLLINKYAEATRMAHDQQEQWKTFDATVDDSDRIAWEKLPITPEQEPGKKTWTSVFISKEGSATSMSQALLELNQQEELEEAGDSMERGFTAPAWVAEGLEIEIQHTRIIQHRQHAAFFMDIAPSIVGVSTSLAEETNGQPENAILYLPSQLGGSLLSTERTQRVQQVEYKLRKVACFRAIHRLKVALIQKKNLIKGKKKQA